MSLAALAKGDKFAKYYLAENDWTQSTVLTPVAGGTLEGNLQSLSVKESLLYQAIGSLTKAKIFFASDPSLPERAILKHTARTDGSLAAPRWYRVLGTKTEGPPGQTWLWIVIVEEHTQLGAYGESS